MNLSFIKKVAKVHMLKEVWNFFQKTGLPITISLGIQFPLSSTSCFYLPFLFLSLLPWLQLASLLHGVSSPPAHLFFYKYFLLERMGVLGIRNLGNVECEMLAHLFSDPS